MKGVHFYEVLLKKDRTRGHKGDERSGNCCAVFYGQRHWEPRKVFSGPNKGLIVHEAIYEGVGCVQHEDVGPNLPVASTAISMGYIDSKCRRVTEQRAREIHPALFQWLEQGSGE